MKKQILSMSTALLCIAGMAGADSAGAQVLTINSGSTLDINGGTLDVNCLGILVKNGGVLTLQAGKLLEKNVLTVEPGGTYTYSGGTVIDCGARSFYVIPNLSGSATIISLPKN